MKTEPFRFAPGAVRRRFALHPLSFAVCMAISGTALALPQGGTVIAGSATIERPTPKSEVIDQKSDKAIIDWRSFSIAGDEKVRFSQPSVTSIVLNRVTGYDPSYILGQMSSNGRIFLVNPYGVVFGAGARVDVGGLVVSTLSIANSDFLASRYNLTSVDPAAPAQRGAIRNEGTISAPGGLVVLAAPSVTNTGTIVANGGRVGLVAANSVSVDVEGDGLIFFQANATEAKNRLEQLGRIQADGGTIEMRAVARGAFADTVLNMTGVVQARSIGTREGKVVIDGGGDGITTVSGKIDATGLAAGERGGETTIQGQRVLIDNGAVVDVSGSSGGGLIRVGGDFHGANPVVRNAEYTGVAPTAQLRADAVDNGDGGKVAVWSDKITRYDGSISAQGGKQGGDGGFVEVSGKEQLAFRGNVSTLAPKGKPGTLLLDPADILITDNAASPDDAQLDADTPTVGDAAGLIKSTDVGATFTLSSAKLEAIGNANAIDLQATNSIVINDLVTNVTTTKTLTLNGGDASFRAGAGGISMASDNTIKVTNGSLTMDSTAFGAGAVVAGTLTAKNGMTLAGTTVTLNGPLTVTAAGHGVSVTGATTLAAGSGTVTLTGNNAGNAVAFGTIDGAQALAITATGGDIVLGAVGGTTPLTGVTLAANTASLGAVTTSGAQDFSGVTTTTLNGTLTVNTAGAGVSAGATTLAAGGGTITLTGNNAANDVTLGTVDGAQTLAITATGGDVTLDVVGGGTTLGGVSINANTASLQNVKTDGNQTYNAAVSAGAVTLDAGTGSISAINAGNDFTGAVTLKATGANVAVRDANALTLAAPTLGANTGLTAIAGTTLTLPGGAISTGTGSIDLEAHGAALATPGALSTSSGSITLVGSAGLTVAHDLTTTSGAISLTGGGAGGLTVNNNKTVDAGNNTITLNGGGGVIDLNTSTLTTTNATAAAITVHNGTTLTLGDISATGGGVVLGIAQDVSGLLKQNGGTSVAADTLSISTAGVITLDKNNAINHLGAVARGGDFTLNDAGGGLTLTGSVSGGTTSNAVNISTSGGALVIGANDIKATTGAGDITLAGVGVTQTGGTITAGGATVINAGNQPIDLQSATNDFTGAVTLNTTGASAAIQDTNALTLAAPSLGANTGLTAKAGTTLTLPAGAIHTGTGSIDLEANGGTLATPGTLTTTSGAITLVGAAGLTIANALTTTSGPISLTGGGVGLTVNSGINVDAGNSTITASGGGGTIQLNDSTLTTTNNSASAMTIGNATTVALGNLVTGAAGTTTLGAGDISAAVSQNALTSISTGTITANTSGSITLDKNNTIANLGAVTRGGDFTLKDTAGGLTLTGSVSGGTTTNAVSITTAGGALVIGGNDIKATTGAGNVTLTGVGVTQTAGAITAGGTTLVNAGNQPIDLQSATNDFTGAVTLNTTGASAAIQDANALTLAAPTLGANTGLTAVAGTTLTLPAGPINVGTGDLDLRSLGGALATPGNLSAKNISLTGSTGLTLANNLVATNAVTLNTTNSAITQSAGTTINAGLATTFNAGNGTVTLDQANILNSIGGTGGTVTITEASAGGVALDAINAASLTVTTSTLNAPVTQNAPVVVAGATTINAGAGSGTVTLTDPGNNFGSFGATAGAVSIKDINAIVLNAINATSLNADTSAGNGAVTQTAALNVTNATTINAGGGAITLGAANTLGSFGATGGVVSLTEGSPGGIALDNIVASGLNVDTHVAGGNVSQTALKTLTVTGATAINAGAGSVVLANGGNDFGSFGATGTIVSIKDINALALDAINATSLTVDTSVPGNGALTQNAAAIVTGPTVVTTGSGAIALNNPGNDFSNAPGNSFTGGAISVRDANDLTVTTLASGPNQAVSVVAGLALTLPAGAINTGAGDLTLSATTLTLPGILSGTNISLTGGAGVIIGADVNAAGNLNLTTTNTAVNQTAGRIISGGATTVTAGIGNVTLARPANDFNSVNVVSGGIVSVNDTNALTAAAVASNTLTITSGGILTSGGALSGTNVALSGTGGISLGNNVTATGTLNLSSTNSAISQTGGAISATAGLTTVAAGSGDVTLNQAGNDFSNVAGISVTGGAVRLRDSNALVIASLANGANKDLSLTAGTTISGVSGNIDTGSADLTIGSGAGFTTFGTLRGTNVALDGGSGGLSLGNNITALGNLTLTAANAPVNQTAGAIGAAGTTTANAGNGAITLTQPGNNFATFGATGGTVNVADANGLVLGATTATTLTIDSSAGNGAITQSGPAVVTGATTVNAGNGGVTLNNAGNDFASIGVTGGAVVITDSNAIALDAINATSLAVNTSAGNGAVTQNAPLIVGAATAINAGSGAVTLANGGNNFGSFGATGGAVTVTDSNALALDAVNATSLIATVSGALTQNAPAVVAGATIVNAGGNNVTLGNGGNDFGNIAITGGAVSVSDSNALALGAINAASLNVNTSAGNGAVTQTAAAIVAGLTSVNAGSGAVTLGNAGNNFATVAATGGAVTIRDANAVILGAVNASGLAVDTSAGNGAVTQSGAAIVSGVSNVTAGSGAVTLNNPGNDFATLSVSGGAVTIVDANALTLTALTSGANQVVNVSTGGALTLPASAIDTGTAGLTLSSGGALTTAGTLRGTNVAINSGGAMTLVSNVTALGTLGLTSINAPILQTGGAIVAAGATTVNAGSGDVTLARAGNDFQGPVSLVGGAVSVVDANNLAVSSLTNGTDQLVSLVAGGSLVLPAAGTIATGTADLTLSAGGSLAIAVPLSGNNVTLTGATGLSLGAGVTSSGNQTYTTPVTLTGTVALDAGASKIDLQGGVVGNAHDLSLTSSSGAFDAIHTGAAIGNVGNLAVNGNSALHGDVTSSGNQVYTGPVTLETGVTLNANGGKIDLQGGVDAQTNTLALSSTNAAADAVRARAPITGAAQLTITGKSTLAGGVATTGTQTYSDTVTLGGAATFSGSSLSFGNGIVAGGSDLSLQSDTLALAGVVSGSGNATLASQTQSATVGLAGGAGAYQISQAALDKFSGFATLTIGRADGTGDIHAGNLVLPTQTTVQSASGNVTFTTVDSAAGQARNLSVSTGGTTTFNGAVGGAIGSAQTLGTLTVAASTALDASTNTSGAQTFGGAVAVGVDATVSASAVSFGAGLDVATHSLTLLTDALSIAGSATGSGPGNVRVAPNGSAGSIGVAGAPGTLQLSQSLVDTLSGIPTLTVGRNDGSGAIGIANLGLRNDLAVSSGSSAVSFTGTLDSAGAARNVSVTTAGLTSFGGAVGAAQPLASVSVAGPTQLGGNVTTTGAQSYGGATTLTADSTLSAGAGSITFGGSVDGGHALAVNATTTVFGGNVGATAPLASLTTDAAGTTQLGGNVTTSGAQTYNDALLLNANAALAGSTLTLAGSVDGAHTLALNGATQVTLGGPIGATTPLAALSTSGPLLLGAGQVTTTGTQSFAGATTLGAATTLAGSAISFGGAVDGPFDLTLQSAGATSFSGSVGATTPLASLIALGGGPVALSGAAISTSGAQNYSGALQLAGTTQLTASSLTLAGPVSGATDLTLQTNALAGATSLSGTGILSIVPNDPTISLGVAGGAGALQIAQAVLDGASGFTVHVIGRTDGSGTISAGNLVLRADTTLQTASGDIALGGSVDGAFALNLNSGATTSIAGPTGATTPLKSLTTDNNPNATDGTTAGTERTLLLGDASGTARITTTGAQTYNDPIVASVPVSFAGTAIVADQPLNQLAADASATPAPNVLANADTLQLHSTNDIRLGNTTLGNGGDIESETALHLAGTIQLGGGTLLLVAKGNSGTVPLSSELTGKSVNSQTTLESTATIVQDSGTISSAAGSLLSLKATGGGSIDVQQAGNNLLGKISAVSGTSGDNDVTRFQSPPVVLSFIRLASTQINVAGAPPNDAAAAGIEADVVRLQADTLTTGPDGLIRARLPFNNLVGSNASIPGITFELTPTTLAGQGNFGTPDGFVQIRVGAADGGFITARPNGVSGNNAVIFLGGPADVRPFYDGNGKLTEIRVFYNGDAPRTPQEAGALAAVIALIEDARHQRFEEAVRTENVTSRLRSGVIAEVGAGRPATVGRESIKLPEICDVKAGTLRCE